MFNTFNRVGYNGSWFYKNKEIEKSLLYKLQLKGAYADVLKKTDELIRAEEKEYGENNIDPRLYHRKASAIMTACQQNNASICEKHGKRQGVVDAYLRSIKIDPTYLFGINDYLWFSSHTLDKGYPIIKLKDENIEQFKLLLSTFENLNIVKNNVLLLNTIAESYASLHLSYCSEKKETIYKDKYNKYMKDSELQAKLDLNPKDFTKTKKRINKKFKNCK